MKIYTKTGDGGITGLADGSRVDKDSNRIKAIGEIDELNALLGVIRVYAHHDEFQKKLDVLQNQLFVLGSDLAAPTNNLPSIPRINAGNVEQLERWIDEMTAKIEPLKNFILPGGNVVAAYLHLARAVCRRAERAVIVVKKNEDINDQAVIYLNRLADFLFTMARYVNKMANVEEVKWKS